MTLCFWICYNSGLSLDELRYFEYIGKFEIISRMTGVYCLLRSQNRNP